MMNLKEFNLKDLKEVAKMAKVKGFSTMKKEPLIEALTLVMEADEEIAVMIETRLEEIDGERPVKAPTAHPSLGIKELTFNGKTQSITAWAEEIGIARPALYDRINRHGWSVEEALTIPNGQRRKTVKVVEANDCEETEE